MFKDREEAGRLLGKKLLREIKKYEEKLKEDFVALGIPRGGVVVGEEVARILDCPLDVIVVKKLGAPSQSELAIGAIGETKGSIYLDKELVSQLKVDDDYIEEIKKLRYEEIKERERLYRQGKPLLDLKDKIVIVVDDGAATGATVISACREVWNSEPKKVIVGLPVLAKDTLKKLEKEADEVIFLEAPRMFFAVGQFYEEFEQVEDQEVVEILKTKN